MKWDVSSPPRKLKADGLSHIKEERLMFIREMIEWHEDKIACHNKRIAESKDRLKEYRARLKREESK